MKKIIFLQIQGKSMGGIWTVNKTLANEFLKNGYSVEVCSLRNNRGKYDNTDFKQYTINTKDIWEITHRRDVINSLKKGFKIFIKTLLKYFKDYFKLKKDYSLLKRYIKKIKPDYIIASHYQTLPGIPQKYLKRTVHVQHSSFKLVLEDKKNFRTLKKYNKKLNSLVWMCKSALKLAEQYGFKKNIYIYNPAPFSSFDVAKVNNNKTFVVLTRISPEKRIDLMIKIVNEVLEESNKNWKFLIYGEGKLTNESLQIIEKNKQIIFKGVSKDSKKVLINSSCYLNTSLHEGLPLTFIEALTCGVPVVTFKYGESVEEVINDKINGFIIKQNDTMAYKEKLKEIMNNSNMLDKMAKNAKISSKKFSTEIILKNWINVFKDIDERN